MSPFEPEIRRLVLAAELAAWLHDLGKAHPGFAREKLKDGRSPSHRGPGPGGKRRISEGHGTLLEANPAYGPFDADARRILTRLRADPDWARVLQIPDTWEKHPGTIQVRGLGDPLRQHHASNDFPEEELSFLGDLYTFAADGRDSALDKGSGHVGHSNQSLEGARIADAFGRPGPVYGPGTLEGVWREVLAALEKDLFVPGATADLAATRRRFLGHIERPFRRALGETRRPTNDVTLYHHAASTAALFKAAVAEQALRGDLRPLQDGRGLFDPARLGRVRFRLLGVRWDWREITRGLLAPVAMTSLGQRRGEAVADLRRLIEEETALGNLVYTDDEGVLCVLPGLYEDDPAASEALFAERVLAPLEDGIEAAVARLGSGVPYRLCWSAPRLYLTDYRQALGLAGEGEGMGVRHRQAGTTALRRQWQRANGQPGLQQICPQCGLRPAGARELRLDQAGKRHQDLCRECAALEDQDAKQARHRFLDEHFGFRPVTLDLGELAKRRGSPRIVLISVRVDPAAIASGEALVTQIARPLKHIDKFKENERRSLGAWGDRFQKALDALRRGKAPRDMEKLRILLGDDYWGKERDGRGPPLEVAEDFFLRESAALPRVWGLTRHEGDRLALFGVRKHPSPARLQRTWDDLRETWRSLALEWAEETGDALIPLSLDAGGLRLAAAATDADTLMRHIGQRLQETLARVRGGLAAQVSVVVARPRFPLYLALETLYRLEDRIQELPPQPWTLRERHPADGGGCTLVWETPQGTLTWSVPEDPWHAHLVRLGHAAPGNAQGQGGPRHQTRRGPRGQDRGAPKGPDRLVPVADLKPGDRCLVPPMTLDFVVLEGAGRRYQIRYRPQDDQILRPHWALAEGAAPLLLETYPAFARLVGDTGWNPSRLKAIQGEFVETYERWVRDVPEALRERGRAAWRARIQQVLRRYVADEDLRRALARAVEDGRFYQAVEWTTHVLKSTDGEHA